MAKQTVDTPVAPEAPAEPKAPEAPTPKAASSDHPDWDGWKATLFEVEKSLGVLTRVPSGHFPKADVGVDVPSVQGTLGMAAHHVGRAVARVKAAKPPREAGTVTVEKAVGAKKE